MLRLNFILFLCLVACGQVTMPPGENDAMAADSAVLPDDAADPSDAFNALSDGGSMHECDTPVAFELSWGVPQKLSINTGEREINPTISCDNKELYFINRPSPGDIFWAIRPGSTEPWATAMSIGLDPGNTEYERDPDIAPGGLELYFYGSMNGTMIHRATRSSTDMPWGNNEPMFSGRSPSLTGDGLVMYYTDPWDSYQLKRRWRDNIDSPWSADEVVPLPNGWRYQKVSVSADASTLLLFLPPDYGVPPVVARRGSQWVELPDLAIYQSCDFSPRGDLYCDDGIDIYFLPNTP